MNVRNFFLLGLTLSMAGSQTFCLPNLKALFTEPAVRVKGTKALTLGSWSAAAALLVHQGYHSFYSKNKYLANRDRLIASGAFAVVGALSLWQNRRDRHALAAEAVAKAAPQQENVAEENKKQNELAVGKAKVLLYDEAEFNPYRPGLGLGGQACFNEATKEQIQQRLAVLANLSHAHRALQAACGKPIIKLGRKKNDIKRQEKLKTEEILRLVQQDVLPCINAYVYIMNRIAEPRKIFTMEINGILRGNLPTLRAARQELLNMRNFFKLNQIELPEMTKRLSRALRDKIPQTLEVSQDVPSAFLNYYAKKPETSDLFAQDDLSDDERELAGLPAGTNKGENKDQKL